MIQIKQMSINSEEARSLIQELNQSLMVITGDDGASHFKQEDMEQERSVFLVGYVDGIPYGCGALRKISSECGEIKRVYARKNSCGLGHAILEALEQKAVLFGYQKLILETRIQNVHAIQFYHANGYAHCENYGIYKERTNAYCFMKELSNTHSITT